VESPSKFPYSSTINIINYSYQCAAQFRIAEVDQNHGVHEEWGVNNSVERAGESDGKGVDEEITSPALSVENAKTSDSVRFPFILHVSIPGMNIWWLGCKTRVVLSA
jgi:hypothetical protein